jgi:hypothetical protein
MTLIPITIVLLNIIAFATLGIHQFIQAVVYREKVTLYHRVLENGTKVKKSTDYSYRFRYALVTGIFVLVAVLTLILQLLVIDVTTQPEKLCAEYINIEKSSRSNRSQFSVRLIHEGERSSDHIYIDSREIDSEVVKGDWVCFEKTQGTGSYQNMRKVEK